MPKITAKKFTIAGRLCEFGIWYTETDKFFVKDFDENVGGTYTSKKFGANSPTEEDLYNKVKSAIAAYELKIAESKKVIVLNLTAAKPHLEKFRKESRKYNDSEYSPEWLNHIYGNDEGKMGFYIEYNVKMFRKVGDQHEFFEIQDSGRLVNRESIRNLTMYQIIDWTQEKEDALIKLQSMFDTLLTKFVEAMKSPEQFIEAINKQKLLSN